MLSTTHFSMHYHGRIIIRILCGILPVVIAFGTARAQTPLPCDSCETVSDLLAKWGIRGVAAGEFSIADAYGIPVAAHVRRITRGATVVDGQLHQTLHIWYDAGGVCGDTVIQLNATVLLHRESIGGGSQPIEIPIVPARQYYEEAGSPLSGTYFEVCATGEYAGRDTSHRESGFGGAVGGARIYFGIPVADRLEVGVAGEAFLERGRVRLPLFGYFRWSPFGTMRTEMLLTYVPGTCRFMTPGDTASDVPDLPMLPATGATDSTVYCVESRHVVSQAFSPFVYGEAGFVLNGPFDGAGPGPALNEAEYGQYVAGAGVGVPIAGYVIASVGYRYLRLNNRTPCEACSGKFIVNTNTVNAVIITLGVQFK